MFAHWANASVFIWPCCSRQEPKLTFCVSARISGQGHRESFCSGTSPLARLQFDFPPSASGPCLSCGAGLLPLCFSKRDNVPGVMEHLFNGVILQLRSVWSHLSRWPAGGLEFSIFPLAAVILQKRQSDFLVTMLLLISVLGVCVNLCPCIVLWASCIHGLSFPSCSYTSAMNSAELFECKRKIGAIIFVNR